MKKTMYIVFMLMIFSQQKAFSLTPSVDDIVKAALSKLANNERSEDVLSKDLEKLFEAYSEQGRSSLAGTAFVNAVENIMVEGSSDIYQKMKNFGGSVVYTPSEKLPVSFTVVMEYGDTLLFSLIDQGGSAKLLLIPSVKKSLKVKDLRLLCDRVKAGVQSASRDSFSAGLLVHAAEVVEDSFVLVDLYKLNVKDVEDVIMAASRKVENFHN